MARLTIDGPFKKDERLEELRKEVKKFVTREDSVAYVFIKSDQPVGYMECQLHENETPPGCPPFPILNTLGHVARIGVLDRHRRERVGFRLLAAAEQWLMSANCPGMWLDYRADNKSAEILYAKFGFGDLNEFDDLRTNPPHRRRIAGKMW